MQTSIEDGGAQGEYLNGTLERLVVAGRNAYLLRPLRAPDPKRRWIWIAPSWLGVNDEAGVVQHRFFIESALTAGFCVAGVDVGVTFGSPAGADVFASFYGLLVGSLELSPRVRLIAQSNGGLIGYAWAFRHPRAVERILGIYPVLDYFTWPPAGLVQIVNGAEPGLGYGLDEAELRARAHELNPIDNLAPLAEAGTRILHVHGDADELVPIEANSLEMRRRYRGLGGDGELEILPGVGHQGQVPYDCVRAVRFLLAD